jgi:hypothetical protein
VCADVSENRTASIFNLALFYRTLLDLLFDPEELGSAFLHNADKYLPDYTASLFTIPALRAPD